jgi:hypothetical protein
MNAISGHTAIADLSNAEGAPPTLRTLRRTGRKSVRFTGWHMLEALGCRDAGNIWYDLSLYRSVSESIVVELIARRSAVDEQDISRVEVFASLQEAASWLETYPCAGDVPVPAGLAAGDLPMATTVLQAVQLRQRLARITDEYHSLLSDVFEALDITESAGAEALVRADNAEAAA